MKIGLVGNPNCGKTTIFNLLTHSRQRVGNWAGVTVESHWGDWGNHQIVDLPGLYSLSVVDREESLDEQVAISHINSTQLDLIINVVDASNLERNLFLTFQLLARQIPVVIVLNMLDVAQQVGKTIDTHVLSKALGCPVVPVIAIDNQGMDKLMRAVDKAKISTDIVDYGKIEPYITQLIQLGCSRFDAIRILEGDITVSSTGAEFFLKVEQDIQESPDIVIATKRYHKIEQVVAECVVQENRVGLTLTQKIDKVVLDRYLGIPCFLLAMYALFVFAINIGGLFKDFVEILSEALFVDGLASLLLALSAPDWLVAIVSSGIGVGIATTLTFIPIIGAMFLALAFLEDSGYMARAAFVVDRVMRFLGLPGKSFVPMIVGFGCNVPAIMAARTLDKERDRILTILMSPFMSCGARLAIYTVFVAAFFQEGGHNVVFLLYVIGILMAILTGMLLKNTLLKGGVSEWVVELPTYHLPRPGAVFKQAWHRVKKFVINAGTLIVPLCFVIGGLNAIGTDFKVRTEEAANTQSLLSVAGRSITPIFAPMGIEQDNWPATVGLLTGVLAKEVVVGTLNTLYTQEAEGIVVPQNVQVEWKSIFVQAFSSILDKAKQLGGGLSNPIKASADVEELSSTAFGVMSQRFDGQIGAFAYLLFVLLYFPCISATAAMAKELAKKWALFSVCWTTFVAYAVAVIFYQLATFEQHPLGSILWVVLMSVMGILFWWVLNRYAKSGPKLVPTRMVVVS